MACAMRFVASGIVAWPTPKTRHLITTLCATSRGEPQSLVATSIVLRHRLAVVGTLPPSPHSPHPPIPSSHLLNRTLKREMLANAWDKEGPKTLHPSGSLAHFNLSGERGKGCQPRQLNLNHPPTPSRGSNIRPPGGGHNLKAPYPRTSVGVWFQKAANHTPPSALVHGALFASNQWGDR